MVNYDIAGRTYPATQPYLVGREKIREFAAAVQSSSLLARDPAAALAAGYSGVVAPPTFAVIISQRAEQQLLFDPDAGIDFTRLVHGDERFIHERPIVAGDELTAQLTVTAVRRLGANTVVTTVTKIRDRDRALVSTAISTFVVQDPEPTAEGEEEA
ncbi:MAG: UPF0336 protein F8O02_00640 [Pseudoclavibacter caeni]|uniref:UPF0336 protein F8O02_00640 n=1 Tax=Pseudoclavibacter caeni TaxID=908846 RepID=A0A7C8BP55_9MICO|nr:MaoC family dehydratase [Pseudoclavibacter caeni]